MTPQNKAEQLFQLYLPFVSGLGSTDDIKYRCKQCALIAVEELLEATKRYDYTLGPKPSYNDYWLKVKYQIEKL